MNANRFKLIPAGRVALRLLVPLGMGAGVLPAGAIVVVDDVDAGDILAAGRAVRATEEEAAQPGLYFAAASKVGRVPHGE